MEVIQENPALELAAKNPNLSESEIQKILKAKEKRARKKARKLSTQRNAKNGTINHFKLSIINDMFEKEPQGFAHTDSNGRNYYTCRGTTVRL